MRADETRKWRWSRRAVWLAVAVAAVVLALPAFALAHLERPSYWPDPGPDHTVNPPAGGEVPTARSLKSAVPAAADGATCWSSARARRGGSRFTICASRCARPRRRGIASARASRRSSSRRHEAHRLLAINAALATQVSLRLRPAGGLGCGQQRPNPDPAGPLHRAGLPQRPRERPALQPQPPPGRRQRRPHPELRVPGHLPQRPEPHPCAGARGGRRPDRAAAYGPPGDPGPGARRLRAMQPADRGNRPEARGRDHGRGHRLSGDGAGGEARRLRQARRPASGPRRRLRRAELPRARGAGAHLLQRGGRRHPARPREVLLGRRLRAPLLHLRPQPRQELRRPRLRRLGRLPGRRSRDRLAGHADFYPDAPRPNTPSRSATCTAPPSATRARWATPFASPATTSTATPRGSRATPCRPPAIPASRPTARRSTTTTSTRTTSTSTGRDTPVDPLVGVPIGTGILYPGMNDARVHDN